MSPVRGSGWYKRPWRLTWRDLVTGESKHAEFHWEGPARRAYDEFCAMPSRYADVLLVLVTA